MTAYSVQILWPMQGLSKIAPDVIAGNAQRFERAPNFAQCPAFNPPNLLHRVENAFFLGKLQRDFFFGKLHGLALTQYARIAPFSCAAVYVIDNDIR